MKQRNCPPPNQKLKPAEIAEIKDSTEPTGVLAKRYGVARATISRYRPGGSGARIFNQKLTDADSAAIRGSLEPSGVLAKRYGVTICTINAHKRGYFRRADKPIDLKEVRRRDRKRVIAEKRAQLLREIDAIRWRQPQESAAHV